MAKIRPEELQFLDENPFAAVATTLRYDGSPHSTIVWVDVEDGRVSFNTALGRAKPRHLERDPRVSILMADPEDSYRWVAVSGHAELTQEGADAQIDKLAKKYMGADAYPWRKATETRVKVLIDVEHVTSYGFDD